MGACKSNMPKNKGKGGKNRSRAKSDRDGKRELHFKNVDEGQEYAQVLKMHGGPWLEAYCFDGVKPCATSVAKWGGRCASLWGTSCSSASADSRTTSPMWFERSRPRVNCRTRSNSMRQRRGVKTTSNSA